MFIKNKMIEEFNFEKCLQKQLSGLISLKLYGCVGRSFDINPHSVYCFIYIKFLTQTKRIKIKKNFPFTCMFILF